MTKYILVRVPLDNGAGGRRDRHEALQTLAHEPWFSKVEHVCSTRGVHVFRRPADGGRR